MGDATKARVDDLASGWTIEPDKAEPPAAPEPDAPTGRKRPRTMPPPPPGSEARKALEAAIVETKSNEVPRIDLADVAPVPIPKPITNPPSAPSRPSANSAPIPKPITNPPSAPRSKPTTNPPAARKPTTNPPAAPPPSVERSKPASRPPPIPQSAIAAMHPKTPIGHAAFPSERTPAVIVDASLVEEQPAIAAAIAAGDPDALGKLAVPVGEFDTGGATIDEEKLRIAFAQQRTVTHNSADALLGIPAPPKTVVKATSIDVLLGETAERLRADPTNIDTKTSPFERGDPTNVGRDDATEIEPPSSLHKTNRGGTLRSASMLRRKRGIAGDVKYVFTALFGVRQARKELGVLEDRQALRQTSRKRHLVTLGRTAVTADSFDHPALGKARESLQAVEDERSKHAGAVAAADAELDRVRRDRETKSKAYATDMAATQAELAELAKKLEPLEKDAAAARRRAADLKDQLRKVAKKIADTEALLDSVKGEKLDRAGIQAEIASLKADQKSVQSDEPTIAAELDALDPRIAAIKAARTEADKKRSELEKSELEDQRRTTELFEAIGSKRKVVERAAAEAEAARDRVLFELGERLYVDNPPILGAQRAPVDQIDLELGETDRRIMELREILSNIDRPKILRGALMIFLGVAVIGSFVAWLLYMLL
jgi:hypothetical protein